MPIQNWDSTQADDSNQNSSDFDSTTESENAPIKSTATAGDDEDSTTSTLLALQNELEESKNRLNELTNISQQALADLQNFKKRSEEEKARFVSFANASLISDLLPVLDNLDRAMLHIPDNPAAKEWSVGIIAILKQFEQILQAKGLLSIENKNGDFDPNIHEALLTDHGPTDQILKQLEKGYRIGERILRRAKVVVGHGEKDDTKKDN